ncbi:uncharacterized protein LOC117234824 [Bombus vosnesenskii]|uniref:Uncharacterized protein LOC117234824 n=1 Tax=Bombus vosnesenskii TaxID=207650 RepID=A0A6J3KJ29_9HYME|nr:uncharacterized protein LOC117234824 [Bombus vosnesenskii]
MTRPPLNTSKSGNAIDENRRPSNKALKFKKSITTASRKFNSTVKTLDRLVGGADVPEESGDVSKPSEETVEQTVVVESTSSVKTEDGKLIRTAGPCCTCMSQVPGSTGDKKVDEMIDYVHQNLQEAGKALATLGENFEHDSKLMFADIFGRIQQWIGLVQNKLDICKNEIESLRKELIARACEIDNLRRQLAECEEREKSVATTQTVEPRINLGSPEVPVPEVVTMANPVYESVTEGIPAENTEREPTVIKESVAMKEPENIEIICTDVAIQSILKDKDRMRREIELEAEIARLRKENERIIKERAEYENAIQRALLRGVSSLNVEALRVMRCPPIPCCTPCAPCPASAMEPIVSCKKEGASAAIAKGCVTQRSGTCGKTAVREQGCYTVKRPCASPCCSTGKSRKSASNNSMVFLLHQGDTENICNSNNTPMSRVCGSPVMKKIEIPPCPRFII